MTFSKRKLTQEEIDFVVEAIYDSIDPWDRYGDIEEETEEAGNEADKENKKNIRASIEDGYTTWVENAETKEPLFIVIGCTSKMAANGDIQHQEVFEWKDGKLQRFDPYR